MISKNFVSERRLLDKSKLELRPLILSLFFSSILKLKRIISKKLKRALSSNWRLKDESVKNGLKMKRMLLKHVLLMSTHYFYIFPRSLSSFLMRCSIDGESAVPRNKEIITLFAAIVLYYTEMTTFAANQTSHFP